MEAQPESTTLLFDSASHVAAPTRARSPSEATEYVPFLVGLAGGEDGQHRVPTPTPMQERSVTPITMRSERSVTPKRSSTVLLCSTSRMSLENVPVIAAVPIHRQVAPVDGVYTTTRPELGNSISSRAPSVSSRMQQDVFSIGWPSGRSVQMKATPRISSAHILEPTVIPSITPVNGADSQPSFAEFQPNLPRPEKRGVYRQTSASVPHTSESTYPFQSVSARYGIVPQVPIRSVIHGPPPAVAAAVVSPAASAPAKDRMSAAFDCPRAQLTTRTMSPSTLRYPRPASPTTPRVFAGAGQPYVVTTPRSEHVGHPPTPLAPGTSVATTFARAVSEAPTAGFLSRITFEAGVPVKHTSL